MMIENYDSRQEWLVEVANNLSNIDLLFLLHIFRKRLLVWSKKRRAEYDVENIFINGTVIEMTLDESAEEETCESPNANLN